jgi:hypothetical protein
MPADEIDVHAEVEIREKAGKKQAREVVERRVGEKSQREVAKRSDRKQWRSKESSKKIAGEKLRRVASERTVRGTDGSDGVTSQRVRGKSWRKQSERRWIEESSKELESSDENIVGGKRSRRDISAEKITVIEKSRSERRVGGRREESERSGGELSRRAQRRDKPEQRQKEELESSGEE